MSTLRALSAGFLLLGLTAGAAPAQCPTGIMAVPPAGSWVEYRMKEGSMRLAILGRETRNGKESIRLEMAMTGGRGGPAIVQMLVPGWPYEMSGVEELIVKAGNQPAMRMNAQMMGMMRGMMPKDAMAEACRNNRTVKVGDETITVPAGTFRTEHYRDPESGVDVWISREVPFALVRVTQKNGEEMVLTGKGSDARSQITETPQEMPGMR